MVLGTALLDRLILMKEELLSLANKMKEEGQDLVGQPVLFKWTYPEQLEFEFQLLIKEVPDKEAVH